MFDAAGAPNRSGSTRAARSGSGGRRGGSACFVCVRASECANAPREREAPGRDASNPFDPMRNGDPMRFGRRADESAFCSNRSRRGAARCRGGEHAMHMMLRDANRCSSAATGPGDTHVARCGASRRKPDHRADARRRARRTSRPRRARYPRASRNATRRRARPRRASCRLSADVRGRRAAHSPRDTETSSERHTHGKRVLNTRRFDFVRR